VRGGHGGWGGVEIDSLAAGGDGAIEDSLGECAAEDESACGGTDPEALQFPGISFDGGGYCAPGNEPCGLAVGVRDEATAALFEIRERQAGGFFFKRAKAEAGSSGLGDDKASVFKQEFAGLGERAVWGRCRNILKIKWPGWVRAGVHTRFYCGICQDALG